VPYKLRENDKDAVTGTSLISYYMILSISGQSSSHSTSDRRWVCYRLQANSGRRLSTPAAQHTPSSDGLVDTSAGFRSTTQNYNYNNIGRRRHHGCSHWSRQGRQAGSWTDRALYECRQRRRRRPILVDVLAALLATSVLTDERPVFVELGRVRVLIFS